MGLEGIVSKRKRLGHRSRDARRLVKMTNPEGVGGVKSEDG